MRNRNPRACVDEYPRVRGPVHGGDGSATLPLFHRLQPRRHRLDRIEPLEHWVPGEQRLPLTRIAMGEAEGLRLRPGLEIPGALPDRVGGVEHMVLALRPLEEVE